MRPHFFYQLVTIGRSLSLQFSSVTQLCPTLRPHKSTPSSTPGVHSDSRPSSQWCHPAISSSVIPFSSCPHPSQHQSLVAQLCPILCDPIDCSPPGSSVHGRFLCPWNAPGKNTGVSFHVLQGIFPAQRSNPGLLCCRWILHQLSYQGSPCVCVCVCVWSKLN